jgi:signal transduction histidine kinase
LIDAQESERSRIARELHDDIGQQLAVLATNLRLSGDTTQALTHIDAIARSARTLSHRLHPAMLRLTGLVESVRSLQREQCQSGVAIAFTHRDIPRDLPAAVTLCLFRVIQEGVQNAIKHSRARQVSVDVRRVGSDVALSIVDDGRGFDVEGSCGKGLGLISLVERVEAVRGTVVLRSKPGLGTTIVAHVPTLDHDGERLTIRAPQATTCQKSSPYVC